VATTLDNCHVRLAEYVRNWKTHSHLGRQHILIADLAAVGQFRRCLSRFRGTRSVIVRPI
jgi:hypothetical protein